MAAVISTMATADQTFIGESELRVQLAMRLEKECTVLIGKIGAHNSRDKRMTGL